MVGVGLTVDAGLGVVAGVDVLTSDASNVGLRPNISIYATTESSVKSDSVEV